VVMPETTKRFVKRLGIRHMILRDAEQRAAGHERAVKIHHGQVEGERRLIEETSPSAKRCSASIQPTKCSRLASVMTTPFGSPVLPDVKRI